jgi:hypothetical protein
MNTQGSKLSAADGRDYVDSIGAFFLLDKKGKLLALRSVLISDDAANFAPRAIPTDLTPMYPLVSKIEASSIILSVTFGPQPSVHFLMQVNIAGRKQTLRAPGKILDILTDSLENETYPVIAQTDLEKAVHSSRKTGHPLQIPIRSMVLRDSVPLELTARIKDIFVNNATGGTSKGDALQTALLELRGAIRETLLSAFLKKCMWLEKESGRLGNMLDDGKTLSFVPLDSDDPNLSAFLVVLEKDHYGDYVLDFREFARIIPKISKSTPWVGPTLHVYNESYRKDYGLEEYYSLYNGFRALTEHGTPVVILDEQDPLTAQSEIRYVQVSHRSVNVLQGRILDGDVLNEGIRDFTTKDLVWKT